MTLVDLGGNSRAPAHCTRHYPNLSQPKMVRTIYRCQVCSYQTRSESGMENHYSQTPCGARLDERLVRAASKSLKCKRTITPPPTDPTPSSPPYSPASDSGPVPDLPELHAFPHADIDPSAAPPPPKKT